MIVVSQVSFAIAQIAMDAAQQGPRGKGRKRTRSAGPASPAAGAPLFSLGVAPRATAGLCLSYCSSAHLSFFTAFEATEGFFSVAYKMKRVWCLHDVTDSGRLLCNQYESLLLGTGSEVGGKRGIEVLVQMRRARR